MTEQEKQAIREQLEHYQKYMKLSSLEEYVPILLSALDERDREVEFVKLLLKGQAESILRLQSEVERYKESNTVLVISNNDREKENRRLRKALHDIIYSESCETYDEIKLTARQALSGEEKGC